MALRRDRVSVVSPVQANGERAAKRVAHMLTTSRQQTPEVGRPGAGSIVLSVKHQVLVCDVPLLRSPCQIWQLRRCVDAPSMQGPALPPGANDAHPLDRQPRLLHLQPLPVPRCVQRRGADRDEERRAPLARGRETVIRQHRHLTRARAAATAHRSGHFRRRPAPSPRPGTRRVPRTPSDRPSLRCHGRPCSATDARAHRSHRPRRQGSFSRHPQPLRGCAVPLTGRHRSAHGARTARLGGRRDTDGASPRQSTLVGRAVSPRVDLHRIRREAAEQFPRTHAGLAPSRYPRRATSTGATTSPASSSRFAAIRPARRATRPSCPRA
jgi:hypothetical protein